MISDKISISVIIPVFNSEATLDRCLNALANQSLMPNEIIGADNGSTDSSLAILERWMATSKLPLRIIKISKKGAASVRNSAALQAIGEWLAFTDSDCLPDSSWIETGLEMSAKAPNDVFALAGPAWGTMEGDASARLLGLTTLSVGHDNHIFSEAGLTGMQGFAAANLWVRRQAFLDIHGFDESLSIAGEDMDFCARLYANGGRLQYSPRLMVRHIHQSGVAHMCRRMVEYGQVHALLFHRHGKPGIYFDLPIFKQIRLPCNFFFYCNLASAEKKVLLIFIIAIWNPWGLLLLPLYIYWITLFLKKRLIQTEYQYSGLRERILLSMLLILKSAALSWGRLRGSSKGVWTC